MRNTPPRGAAAIVVASCVVGALGCGQSTSSAQGSPGDDVATGGASATSGSTASGAGGTSANSGSGAGGPDAASSGSSGTSGSGAGGAGGGQVGPAPQVTPSGYLLLPQERLATMKAAVAADDPAWLALKARVDKYLTNTSDLWHDSPENRALVYLLTKDAKYAQAAYAWEKTLIDTVDVRFDSYLDFGELMRHAALVLNWCGDALDATQKKTLADYLDAWTNELWFANKGSGWGLADPGNNYHHAFLEGTAFAGHALKQAGAANGPKYVALLSDKLTKPGAVLDYLSNKVVGGDWREGANYGERSKQRLYDALAVVVSMGGPNYFYEHPFFAQSVYFAVYQVQPDREALYPSGDLARDSAMPVTACERDYLQTMAAWLPDGPPQQLVRWYLSEVAPGYDNPYGGLAFKEVALGSSGAKLAPSALPLSYFAKGTGFLNWRSGWDAGAVSITLSAPIAIEQSHQHLDAGSFTLFEGGWLGMDATTLSKTGLTWAPGSRNGIHVAGAERFDGAVGGLTNSYDDGAIAYAAIDATAQYRYRPAGTVLQLMNEVTREVVYARPGVLVAYDRVAPKSGAQVYEWRLHLPGAPTLGASVSYAGKGGGLTLVPLVGGTPAAASDADLDIGGSAAIRVVEPATGVTSRFLNVIAAGAAPPAVNAVHVTTSGAMEGADTGSLVAMFSSHALGAAAALPFSYTVSGTQARTHVIANLAGGVDVAVDKSGGKTTVTVSAGAKYPASASGVVVVKQ